MAIPGDLRTESGQKTHEEGAAVEESDEQGDEEWHDPTFQQAGENQKSNQAGDEPARTDVNRTAAEQPEQRAAEQRDIQHNLPGARTRAGKEEQKDHERDRIAQEVLKAPVQERGGRYPHQADQRPRDHPVAIDAREEHARQIHCPDCADEKDHAVNFLADCT
jgi:hypothetical protein